LWCCRAGSEGAIIYQSNKKLNWMFYFCFILFLSRVGEGRVDEMQKVWGMRFSKSGWSSR